MHDTVNSVGRIINQVVTKFIPIANPAEGCTNLFSISAYDAEEGNTDTSSPTAKMTVMTIKPRSTKLIINDPGPPYFKMLPEPIKRPVPTPLPRARKQR